MSPPALGIFASARYSAGGGGSTYPTEVMADAPSVYLRMADSSGSTFTDASGNSRPATILSGVTLGAGSLLSVPSGDASASFASGYASVPHAAWLNTLTWSAECLFKPSSVSGSRTILSRYTPSGFDGVFHLRQDSAALNFYGMNSAISGFYTCTATGVTLVAGTKYHVVITYDGTSMRIYVNGSLKNTVAATLPTTNTNPLGMGRSNNVSFPEYFAGEIDEVAYYAGSVLGGTRIGVHAAAA